MALCKIATNARSRHPAGGGFGGSKEKPTISNGQQPDMRMSARSAAAERAAQRTHELTRGSRAGNYKCSARKAAVQTPDSRGAGTLNAEEFWFSICL